MGISELHDRVDRARPFVTELGVHPLHLVADNESPEGPSPRGAGSVVRVLPVPSLVAVDTANTSDGRSKPRLGRFWDYSRNTEFAKS